MKENRLSVQDWLEVETILENGIIKLKNNKYIKLIKIIPINFNLKSNFEKETILNSYKIFLKTCNFDIQILIQSNKEDLSHHINNIQKNISKKENKYLEKISKNYIQYINKINSERKSSSKDFYIIISNENKKNNNIQTEELLKNDLKEKYFKIKECLSRTGNSVQEISNREKIEKLFFSILNVKKSNNKIFINK